MTKSELPLEIEDKWGSPVNSDVTLQATARGLLAVEDSRKQTVFGFQRTRQYLDSCSAAIRTRGQLRAHQQKPLEVIHLGSSTGRFILRPFVESRDAIEGPGVLLKQYVDRSDSPYLNLGLKIVELDEHDDERDYLALVYDTSTHLLNPDDMSVVFPSDVANKLEAEHRLLIAEEVATVQETLFESAQQERIE